MEWITVTIASLFAGFVDAVVGGGGLILTPALFSTFPAAMPATLLGTNKSASVWGTSFATWQYQRRVQMHWQAILPAALCGLAGSFAGAWAVTQMSPHFLRKALPLVLVLILLYTLVKKDLGRHHAPRFSGHKEVIAASLIGGCIGLYDGFFGPGTGSFLILAFHWILRMGLMQASATSKVLNLASNFAGAVVFILNGVVVWSLALPMAAACCLGNWLGSRMAIRVGPAAVRRFLAVSLSLLLVTLVWQYFLAPSPK